MKRRYRIISRDKKTLIEMPFNDNGKHCLKVIRKNEPQFKYSRIKDIIQALPDKVIIGRRYETT